MQDDNRNRILALAERVEVPPSDVRAVMERGRRRRFRERAAMGAVLTVIAAAGFVGASRALDDRPNPGPAAASGMAVQNEVENSRVATFAVRALVQAGLADPTGDFNDYQSAQRVEGGWLVTLETLQCDPSSCSDHPDGHGSLEVALDRGTLQIVEANGPYTDAQRQELLSYREEPNDERFGLQFVSAKVVESPDEGVSVIASPLWRGPLDGSAPADVECRVELYDAAGSVVYQGEWRPQPPPPVEALRSGSISIFGIPPEEIEGAPERAAIPCRTT